jgi:hypothetical protein
MSSELHVTIGSRRGRLRTTAGWGVGAALVAGALMFGMAGSAAASPAPVCAAGVCTVTFAESGAPVTWTAPAGVSSASFTLYGADGGTAGPASPGGSGAEVQGTLSVTSGQTYTLNVGGLGAVNGVGYNGGGLGVSDSGGGGGATDLLEGSTPLLVAGGGGGGGSIGLDADSSAGTTSPGGAGGNADQPGGGGGPVAVEGATLGGGGGGAAGDTGGAGGTGGTATGTSTCTDTGTPLPGSGSGFAGGAGSSGQGGGAAGFGGGGGGGYVGGGQGGGGARDNCLSIGGEGGGGGGSSYLASVVGLSGSVVSDAPTLQAASLGGNGEAIISYSQPQLTTTLTVAPQIDLDNWRLGVGLGRVSATLSSAGGPLGPGETISFGLGKTVLCTATTDASGVATCTITALGEVRVLLANHYQATFATTTTYLTSNATTRAVVL